MELFWLKGYASTSIADILSRSQVNSGSLYHFFPGKQDVLLAVLEAYRDGIGHDAAGAGLGGTSTTRSSGSSRCSAAIAGRSSTPSAPMAARSAASRSSCTSPTRSSASGSPRISRPGSTRSRTASAPPRDRFRAGHRLSRPRRVRAERDGGRRDAGAHLSRRRAFRPRGRPAPDLRRKDDGAGRAA